MGKHLKSDLPPNAPTAQAKNSCSFPIEDVRRNRGITSPQQTSVSADQSLLDCKSMVLCGPMATPLWGHGSLCFCLQACNGCASGPAPARPKAQLKDCFACLGNSVRFSARLFQPLLCFLPVEFQQPKFKTSCISSSFLFLSDDILMRHFQTPSESLAYVTGSRPLGKSSVPNFC